VSEFLDLRYVVPALLGLLLLLAYPVSRHLDAGDKARYYILQGITLLGALVGAKIVVLVGDRGWPAVPVESLADVVGAGRSVVGGLLFGFLTAEAAKPVLRYRLPPNDRFAAILPFSLAVGRVGCYLSGCCRGTPWDGWLSVAYADGIARHPAQLYEAGFQIAAGVLLMRFVSRGILKGRLFALYLVAYGAYRFLSEFIRETPHVFFGYSAYQGFCVLMIAAGAAALVLRRKGVHGTATIVPAASPA
jgi:phosphatidylglycerol:prolipoprotein diacylglycerol transferase